MANPDSKIQAVNCLGKPQLEAGFVCACQTYVTGPGLSLKLGQMDEAYESQYGQYEKSWDGKK
jgi:hypothetical protein